MHEHDTITPAPHLTNPTPISRFQAPHANIKPGSNLITAGMYEMGSDQLRQAIAAYKPAVEYAQVPMPAMIYELDANNSILNLSPSDANGLDLGCTNLHNSARRGYSALLELLLKLKSTDIELKDETGVTALATAVAEEQLDCVQLLLKYGANPNTVGPCGFSIRHLDPLVTLAARRSAEVLRSLLEAGADPNVRTHNNNTALMYAAQDGQVDCLTILLATGVVEVNVVNDDGDTALNCAASEGQVESTKICWRGATWIEG